MLENSERKTILHRITISKIAIIYKGIPIASFCRIYIGALLSFNKECETFETLKLISYFKNRVI